MARGGRAAGVARPAGAIAVTRDPPQLAQVNIARMRYAADAREMREFTAALGRINLLAEQSPGFVWRYPTDDGHLSGADLLDDPLTIVNISVWRSYLDLHRFTYRAAHGQFVRRRARWFVPVPSPTTALWWMPAGIRPTPEQAVARLRHLRRHGPSPQAFTVRRRFDPAGRLEPPARRKVQRETN